MAGRFLDTRQMPVSRNKVNEMGETLRPIAEAFLNRRPLPANAEGVVVNQLSTLETEGDERQRRLSGFIRPELARVGPGGVANQLLTNIRNGGPIFPTTGGRKTRRALKLKAIRKSHVAEKKYDAVFERNGREVVQPFGQKGYSDFTKHKDVTRRARYLRRHKGMGENWRDPTSAGALSRWILWNKPTFKASLADYKRRFGL